MIKNFKWIFVVVFALTLISPAFAWWNTSWSYRQAINISNTAGNLTNYQVKIELNSSNVGSHFNWSNNGSDIRFTNSTDDLLNFWIESWNSSGQEAVIWVNVTYLENNTNTTIYMYYGNPSAESESDINATFIRIVDGLIASWHFDEESGDIAYDSSGNDYDGTIYGATRVDGKFGKALDYDGSDDYVDCGDITYSTAYSAEAWIKTTFTGTGGIVVNNGNNRFNLLMAGGQVQFSDFGSNGVKTTGTYNDGNWHHVVGIREDTMWNLYIDGVVPDLGASLTGLGWSGTATRIGCVYSGYKHFGGIIDEVRIYNRTLTSEEISDLYNNYGYTTTNYPGKVLVRKYASPEPSVSNFGSEESAGVIVSFSITLNSPPNQTTTSDPTPDFNFTVSGIESSYSCELFINDTGYGTTIANNNTPTIITANWSLSNGTYNWYINCTAGGITNQSEIREITINATPPAFSITLNSPPNQTTTSDTTPDFNFTVSGTDDKYLCELFIDDIGYGTTIANNNTATIITANQSLSSGTHNWYINCSVREVTNQSEVREITITIPAIYITLNSPPNSTSTCDTTPNFNFTVTGTEANYSCELLINDTGYGTAIANNNTPTIITANSSLSGGNYNWYINCSTNGVENTSETREILIGIQISDCSALNQAGMLYCLNQSLIDKTTSNCIDITANNIVFDCQGYTIDGDNVADYGIRINTVSNVTVKNCKVTNWDARCVNVYYSNSSTFKNITIDSCVNYGFYLDHAFYNIVRNITVTNCGDIGFQMSYSSGNSVINVTSQNNDWEDFDIYISEESHCNNEVKNVTLTLHPLLYSNETVNIANQTFGAIYLCNADNSTIVNVTVESIEQNSISNYFVENVVYENIVCSGLQEAIFFKWGKNNTVKNAILKNGWSGLTFSTNSFNNTMINLTIYNMTGRAIRIYGGSSNNTIKNSKIYNSSVGIYLDTAGQYGANLIYNNFFNNTQNIEWGTTIYENYWNTTKQTGNNIYEPNNPYIGGNFWAKPDGTGYSETCTDSDNDGFCDNPYDVEHGDNNCSDASNCDYLPLSDEYVGAITRSVTTSLSINTLLSKEITSLRKTNATISFYPSILEFRTLTKSLLDEFSVSSIVTRIKSLIKSITDFIGITEFAGKVAIYTREPDVEVYFEPLVLRNLEANRELKLTAQITPEMMRKLEANRELTIAYTIDIESLREVNLNRLTVLHLTLTPQLARNIEVGRDNELSLTITPQLFRELVKTKNILTAITITPEVFREVNLAKINYLTITITPKLARELNLTKSATITIVLTPELIRYLQTEKTVEGAIILTPELIRGFEGARKTADLFQFSEIVERAISLNRAITQSLVSCWTTTYQKIVVGYQEVYQTITLTDITKRTIDVQKRVEDIASLSLISTKFRALTESVSDLFTLSTLADRTLTLFRLPTDIAVLTESTEKTASFGRFVGDTLTSFWTTTYQKLAVGYQEVYQTISLSTTTTRILNIQRSAQDTLTMTVFAKRIAEFVETIYQFLTGTLIPSKTTEIGREVSQNMTTSVQPIREIELAREPTTFLIPQLIADRTIELVREPTTTITFQLFTEKFRGIYRGLTDLINIQAIVDRILNIFRQPHLEEQVTTIVSREAEYKREPYTEIALSFESTKKIITVVVGKYNITIYTQEYAPGDEVYIYAIIPELTTSPTITIYYPNMTEFIEDTMTYFENNIFYYTLTAPNIKGDYLVKVTAGNSTAINTFRVSSAYVEGGGVGIEIFTTGDYLYYPGTTAKIPFTIVSRTNGEPVDYDSIKITIYSPNMTKIAERTTVNKISKGIYYIDYNISSLADYGVYPVVINATSGSYYATRLTSFKVLPAGPLDISITPLKTEVQQGEDLPVKLRIKNLGEGRTITYTYRIYSANNTYYTETSSLTLNRYEDKQLIKTIPLPITADTGIATLELNVSYSPSEPSIYNTNFVTITYSPRGYTPKILTITFNLTPERQYLTILRNNDTIFSGIIHNRDTMQLSEGKYKFIFTAEGYFKKTAEIYLDRDLIITSKLSSATIPILFAENIYKIILILLIVACIIIFYKFRFLF